MKSYKKFLALFLAVMHVLTFSSPAQQINIQEGTTVNVDSVQVNEGEQLSINVVDQLGQVCPSCRGILETNNFLNNGAIDIWGILAIIAPTIINNGTITVQGDLLLSNLGINKEQFFAGIAELSKDPSLANGYILNTGDITNLTQGLLAMIAANGGVHNLGTISSNGGAVVLAAGDRASFPLTRDGVLNIDLGSVTGVKGQVFDKDGNLVETNGLVTNAGVLQANGGAVVLQAAGAEAIYDSIINHTGIIEAKSVAQENGKIILKSETGNITVNNATIDASGYGAGEKGGSIELLTAGNIIVDGQSILDASGDNGGGSILIGGDVSGSGSLNASNVGINSDVKVKADAVTSGNGGKIVLWSEGATLAYGDFSAKGGAQFGNGGFIETSGKEYLDVDGIGIDASAQNGEAGTWLLDPRTVNITNSPDSLGSFSGANPKTWDSTSGLSGLALLLFVLANLGNASNVSAASIQGFLNAGTSVVITTNSNLSTTAGDINVLSAIAKTAGTAATLSLIADGAINIDAAITATVGLLNVILTSGSAGGINLAANISTNGGDLTMTAGTAGISQTAGTITANLVSFISQGAVSLAQTGNIWNTITGTTTSGAINIADSGTSTTIQNLQTVKSGAGAITYNHTGAGDVTVTGTVSSGKANPAGTNGGHIVINSSNGLTIANTATLSTLKGSGGVFSATGGVTFNGTETRGAGNITLVGGLTLDLIINSPISSAANVVLSALRDIILNTSITTTGGASVSLTADSDLNGVGGVWLKSPGSINSDGNVTLTGSAIFDAGAAGESVRIDSGTTVVSNGDIVLRHSTVSPAGTDILINGSVTSNGAGKTITVDSLGTITTSNDGVSNLNADNISLESVEGVDVEVDADNLSYNNSTSGNVGVEDMAGGLTLTGATNGGSGSTTILTHSPLTIAANMIQAGAINLSAGESAAATDHLTVNTGITVRSTGSTVTLNAGDNVVLNSSSTVQSNTGAVSITAGSGDTDNAGNISLGGLVSAATTVTLSALKGLISDTNGATNNVTATSLTATSATGIDLDTTITTLTNANVSGTGAIDISDLAGGLAVTSATTNDGAITIRATGGNLDATTVTAGGTSRNVALSTTTSGNINIGSVTAAGDGVTLTSAGSITDTNAAVSNIQSGTLTATAVTGIDLDTTITTLTNASVSGTGAIDISDLAGGLAVTSATTNNGAITINATGGNLDAATVNAGGASRNITLSTTTSGNVNVGNVTAAGDQLNITSAGAIEELGSDVGADLTSGTIVLTAVSGIGKVDQLEIDATTLQSASTSGAAGTISLSDVAGGLAVASATTTDGAITINATGGNLNVSEARAFGTGRDLTLSTTTSGDVNVHFAEATGDNITITSVGAIEELGSDGGADVVGQTVNLTAVTGIGKAAQLEINATTLTNASTTAATGTINLSDIAGGLAVTSATTTDGAITINATGGNLDATTVTAGGTGRNVNLSTTTSGNIRVGTVSALGDTANITSAGTIGELVNDDAGIQSSDINAGTINLTTGGGDIGAPASYLDITPTTLWNATSNGGGIYISCIGVCPMGQIDAGTGTFYYAGNITDGNDTVRGFFDEALGVWKAIDSGTAADWNIRAGGVHLDAANTVAGFIGSATNWIEMRLGSGATLGKITAAAGTGGIHISNDDIAAHPGLQVGGVTAVPAPNNLADGLVSTGGIEIYSFSPLVIAANVIDNSANSIDLVAAGNLAADDLTVNTGVTVDQQGSGTVRMFAGDAVNLNGTAVVQSTTGTVSANAGEDFTDLTVNQNGNSAGSIVMSSTSAFRSQSGNINLTANDHAQISEVNADSNATGPQGNVTIEADKNASGVGRIEDMNGASTNVTGNKLTMNAGSGIGVDGANIIVDAIETSIVRLALNNSTSGHAAVTEVSAGGNMDIESATQNAASDDLTIRTTNGNLTVLDAVSSGAGVSAKAGETLLEANGATGDLVINNTVTSTTGKINLDSTGQDVLFSADGDVTATGGAEIEVTALRNVTMADGTVLNANGGGTVGASALGVGIDIIATNGNVTLGSVQTTSTASTSRGNANNAVTISALNGAVIDGGDTSDNIIANAGETVINAKNGIGHGNSIETQIDRLTATNSTSNDIDIRETIAGGDLNIVRLAQAAATGRIDVQTLDGTLTVLSETVGGFAGNGVVGLAGEIFLRANGAGSNDDLVLNNQIQSSTGKINLDSSSRDVIADAEGDVTATGGAEIESDSARNITMADGTIWNSGSGILDLDATDDITIGSLQSTNNTVNAVTVVSQNGQIIDGGDTDVDIKTGGTGAAHLVAKTGIGSANGLETQIGQLAARTQTGNIQLFNTGDMTITSLTDADSSAQSTLSGGTTSGVQITDPANANTGANFIFVTNNGNLTVNNDASNLDGGDVSLYSFGNVGLGDMNINANIESIGANGNMRVVSGGDMNMAANTNVSTEGNGVVSGTGAVVVAAGYDVSGKTRNPDMSVNPAFAADVLPGLNATSLATTSTNGAGSLLDTVKDATANLTMDETARISTEDSQIIVDAQNNFTVGRVDADGNAGANGITDGTRGNILAFARNGSILDAEGPGFEVGNLDFLAKSLTMLAAGTIGLSSNHIEGDAPLLNTFSVGSQFVDMLGNTQVEMNSASGSIFLTATGTILLGHMSAPSGEVHASAGSNILSQGGDETRVTASNLIELIAKGIVGTTSNPIHTQLNATPAQLNLSAGGQAGNGVSAAVFSNVSPLAVNMLNNPPGLVLFNGTPIAGQSLPGLIGNQASLYYKAFVRGLRQYNDFDGNYAADFPGFLDFQNLITSPDLGVDTTGLDIPLRGITTAPRVVPIPQPAVPTPVQPPVAEQKPAVQPQVPELSAQEPTPPAVVPIPAKAQPSDQATTDEGIPETPAASN